MRKISLIVGILTGLTCFACSDDGLPTWNGSAGSNGGGGVNETGTINKNSSNRGERMVVNGDTMWFEN